MKASDVRMMEAGRGRWFESRAYANTALSAILLATTACGCPTVAYIPTADPRTATLRIGQSFTPKVGMPSGSCADETVPKTWAWSTNDSAFVRVDAATGRTTGIAVGTAIVKGLGNRNIIGTEPRTVTVTVTVVP